MRLIILFLLAMACAFAVDIPDAQALAVKHVSCGSVDIAAQLVGTPYMTEPSTTHHYFLVRMNNTGASAASVSRLAQQNIVASGVQVLATSMFTSVNSTDDGNFTHFPTVAANAVTSIPAGASKDFILQLDTPAWSSGTFNFTAYVNGQPCTVDPTISACGTTISSSGTYTVTADLSCTAHFVTISASSVTLDFQGHTETGDGGTTDDGVLVSATYATITIKNGILNSFGDGITATDASGLTIQNMTISGSTNTGTYAGGIFISTATATKTGFTITGNTVRNGAGAATPGIVAYSSSTTYQLNNVNIASNNIYGNPGNGILVFEHGSMSGLTIDSNTVTANGGGANILAYSDCGSYRLLGSITNNIVTDSGGTDTGIQIGDVTANCGTNANALFAVTGNTVSNINGYGIRVYGAPYLNVSSNSITNTNGVAVTGKTTGGITNSDFSYNNITTPNSGTPTGLDFIIATGTANPFTVNGNTITGYTKGIQVAGGTGTTAATDIFTGNTITNGGDCIVINGDSADAMVFNTNTCTGQSGYGISQTDADNLQYTGNTITNAGNYAFYVAGAVTWTATTLATTTIYSTSGKFISNNGGTAIPVAVLTAGLSSAAYAAWGSLNFANAHVLDTSTSHFNTDWIGLDGATLSELIAPTSAALYCAVSGGTYAAYNPGTTFAAAKQDAEVVANTWKTCTGTVASFTSPTLGSIAIEMEDQNITITAPLQAARESIASPIDVNVTLGKAYDNCSIYVNGVLARPLATSTAGNHTETITPAAQGLAHMNVSCWKTGVNTYRLTSYYVVSGPAALLFIRAFGTDVTATCGTAAMAALSGCTEAYKVPSMYNFSAVVCPNLNVSVGYSCLGLSNATHNGYVIFYSPATWAYANGIDIPHVGAAFYYNSAPVSGGMEIIDNTTFIYTPAQTKPKDCDVFYTANTSCANGWGFTANDRQVIVSDNANNWFLAAGNGIVGYNSTYSALVTPVSVIPLPLVQWNVTQTGFYTRMNCYHQGAFYNVQIESTVQRAFTVTTTGSNPHSYSNTGYVLYDTIPYVANDTVNVTADGQEVCYIGAGGNLFLPFNIASLGDGFGGFFTGVFMLFSVILSTVVPYALIIPFVLNDMYHMVTTTQMSIIVILSMVGGLVNNVFALERGVKNMVILLAIAISFLVTLGPYTGQLGVNFGPLTGLLSSFNGMISVNGDFVSVLWTFITGVPGFVVNLFVVVLTVPSIVLNILFALLAYISPSVASGAAPFLTPIVIGAQIVYMLKAYEILSNRFRNL